MHRARAALAVIATFLRPGESDGLTDAIQQSCARINAKTVILAIDPQSNRDAAFNVWLVRDCRRAASWKVVSCASSDDYGRRSTSHCAQEYAATRIRWARLFVVIHTVSLL